jgi:small multidrug resistance family-3 protein
MTVKVALFTLAAFFEIAGCFSFWMWLRRGASPLVALLGLASLMDFIRHHQHVAG